MPAPHKVFAGARYPHGSERGTVVIAGKEVPADLPKLHRAKTPRKFKTKLSRMVFGEPKPQAMTPAQWAKQREADHLARQPVGKNFSRNPFFSARQAGLDDVSKKIHNLPKITPDSYAGLPNNTRVAPKIDRTKKKNLQLKPLKMEYGGVTKALNSDRSKNTMFAAGTGALAAGTAAKANDVYDSPKNYEERRLITNDKRKRFHANGHQLNAEERAKVINTELKAKKLEHMKQIPKNKAVQGLAAGTLALGTVGAVRHARSKRK